MNLIYKIYDLLLANQKGSVYNVVRDSTIAHIDAGW